MNNTIRILVCQIAIALTVLAGSLAGQSSPLPEAQCPGGSAPSPAVIWCDDFEGPQQMSAKYFDYDSDGGDFVPVAVVGLDGSTGLRARWQAGEDNAGAFKRMFGRNPIVTQSHGTEDIRELYWRQYVRTAPGWTGNPFKLSRATAFANSAWAQGMIAHVWGDGSGDGLILDPASGIGPGGQLATTKYNDFANLRWLGAARATVPVFASASANRWYCVEAHVNLNTPGEANGVFELWIDGVLDARLAGLDWVGTWQQYGINAVAFENYWNGGAPGLRERIIDHIVISKQPIGCRSALPMAPRNLRVTPGIL